MTDFQAVDLDAVLDEFESSQNQDDATSSAMSEFQVSEDLLVSVGDNADSDPFNRIKNLKQPNEKLSNPVSVEPNSDLKDEVDGETTTSDLLIDSPVVRDDINVMAPSTILNVPPDLLAGAENAVDENSAECLEAAVSNVSGDEKLNSPTPSSSSDFESIYDKYRDKSDDEPEQKDDQQAPSSAEEKAVAVTEPVAFEPVYVSNDELDAMLEQLDVEENQLGEENIRPQQVVQPEMGGARPKDRSYSNPANRRPSHVDESSDVDEDSNGAKNCDEAAIVPDIVANVAREDAGNAVPADSPPPYSEIDPMKHVKLERPTSLDVGPKVDKSTAEQEESTIVDTDVERRQDEDAGEDADPAPTAPPGSTPANPNAESNFGALDLLQGLTEEQLMLGKVTPFWIPDADAASCMICGNKFTVMRRRHHCRACGQVLCSICCSEKAVLAHMEDKEGRVCKPCKTVLDRLAKAEQMSSQQVVEETSRPAVEDQPDNGAASEDGVTTTSATTTTITRPNPSNPMEYCSTIPPLQQVAGAGAVHSPPSVMVPVGVLKRSDTMGSSNDGTAATAPKTAPADSKSVMFSDGVRPGGDLADLDGSTEYRRPSRGKSSKSGRKSGRSRGHATSGPAGGSDVDKSLIPHEGLPMVAGEGVAEESELTKRFLSQKSVPFALNRNLRVYVKLVHYSPVSEFVWNYRTAGMSAVGKDEVVVLLVKHADEDVPPGDVFEHLQSIYEMSGNSTDGSQVANMSYTAIPAGSRFLGSTDFGGFLYFRHSFQCLDDLDLPAGPFLFGVLITKWEITWARVFPLRLLLRLGAESRYYPSPLWSWRDRKTVYKEVGNTIMNLLSDFRNFTYALPTIRGLVIHMEDKLTSVLVPQQSHAGVRRALQNSNEPVLALGANFSPAADSHLVAVQRDDDDDESARNALNASDYETRAISIQNKARKVTGASFLVLNGALKSSQGLTAKSSIVEDGIMVRVSQDRMMAIRKSLDNMEDVRIECGPVGIDQPDEVVLIKWIVGQPTINVGIKSLIDGSPMDGIKSIRTTTSCRCEFVDGRHLIRWTEVFLLPNRNPDGRSSNEEDPVRVVSHLAKAICHALRPHMKKLRDDDLSPLAVRVTLDPESACYEAGARGSALPPEYMNALDNELVPLVHSQWSTHSSFEFVFHILDLVQQPNERS